jgi:uncharacterized membrane protein HdeD (DUF308 family)
VASNFLVDTLVRNWWVWLVRGIFAMLFAIMAFAWPGITILTLVILFGIYAAADGLTALWIGGSSRAWWLVLAGVVGVIIGIYTFIYPGITAVALLCLIAVWAIVCGILEIITGVQLRKEISKEWVLIIGGIISIVFGVALLSNPATGALAMVWLIGSFALVFGVTMIVLALRVRTLSKRLEGASQA